MNRVKSLNLKLWLTLVISILTLCLYATTSLYQWRSEKQTIFGNAQETLQFNAMVIARELEQLRNRREFSNIDDLFAYHSVNTRYKAIFLVNRSDFNVVVKGNNSRINQHYYQLSKVDKDVIKKFNNNGEAKFITDRPLNLVSGYFSISDPNSQYINDRNFVLIVRYSVEDLINQSLKLHLEGSIFTASLFIVFIFLLFSFHHKFIELPYQELIKTINRFSNRQKEFKPRIYGSGEFKKLSDAFFTMAGTIENQFEELSNTNDLLNRKTQTINSLFQVIPDLLFVLNEQLQIIDYHSRRHELFYVPPEEFIHKRMDEVLPPKVGKLCAEKLSECLATNKLITFEYELVIKDELFYYEARIAKVNDTSNIIMIVRDVSAKKQNEEFIERQAFYDSLTELPNRYLALDRLATEITVADRNNAKVAVAFIDLDDFKNINDLLGHQTGDALLVETAKRLKSTMRESDTVARLGGDEFVLVCPLKQIDGDGIANLMMKVIANITKPFIYQNRNLNINASIGIAIYPDDANNADDLLRLADVAMYHAKENGKNHFVCFNSEMNELIARKMEVEEHLHRALENGELTVHYQPQFDLTSSRLIGAEALVRWHSKVLGMVSPAEFIPIAEHNGDIEEIGRFVIEQSITAIKRFNAMTEHQLRVAINLSPRQLRDNQLLDYLDTKVKEHNIDGSYLEFEITEGVLLSKFSNSDEVINELHHRDIKIAMDDFGTGYSSLKYLQEYAFDIVKVDRTFVMKMEQSVQSRELVKAIIGMAHHLHLKVLAEGVETLEQLNLLKQFGCDYIQGYYMGAATDADNFLEQWSDAAAVTERLS